MPVVDAQQLAERIAGPVQRFEPGRKLTTFASWFTTVDLGTILLVATGEAASQDSVSEAVAYALAWQQDADLALILPETLATPTLHRLAFISTPVRVWTYGSDGVPRPAVIPTRDEAIDAARTRWLRGGDDHNLGDHAAWVAPLVESAESHWALVQAHRTSYLAWHCNGRQVLRLSRARSGVKVLAGVQYRYPPEGREPVNEVLTRPIAPDLRARIEAAIALAVSDRLGEADTGHGEHQMQAALSNAQLPGLGVIDFQREYPAWRADGKPGYIDFLAVDNAGKLHVVETKIGSDPLLVFQALDYAIFVAAHADAIRNSRKPPWPGNTSDVMIDFVVAPKKTAPAVGPYTAAQLQALDRSVEWRVHVVEDPLADTPTVTSLPRWAVPTPAPGRVATPVRPPRYETRVQEELLAASKTGRLMYSHHGDALAPAALETYEQLRAAGLTHRYALHVRSSQAFALNLFCPLDEAGRREILEVLGLPVATAEEAVFEFTDDANRLAERRPHGVHQTQVDVALRGTTDDGERVVALIEVKFTETDFGSCSAYLNPDNPARDVCRCDGLFGGQPDRCFQLASHGAGRRRYDSYLDGVPVSKPTGLSDTGGCIVRGGRNQPMRNLALAHVLLTDDEADRAVYALCAPSKHAAIWRRFEEAAEAFPDTETRTMRPLTAEAVAALHPDGGAAIADRYALTDLAWSSGQ
jgi:hypothetical protein